MSSYILAICSVISHGARLLFLLLKSRFFTLIEAQGLEERRLSLTITSVSTLHVDQGCLRMCRCLGYRAGETEAFAVRFAAGELPEELAVDCGGGRPAHRPPLAENKCSFVRIPSLPRRQTAPSPSSGVAFRRTLRALESFWRLES